MKILGGLRYSVPTGGWEFAFAGLGGVGVGVGVGGVGVGRGIWSLWQLEPPTLALVC